jgi:hypothetical protein
MKSLARSQSARRRAAATAAIASVGAGILGTHSAEAAIVPINIGPTGFNIGGANGGVTSGGLAIVSNFPTYGQGFYLANGYQATGGVVWGLTSQGPLKFAAGVNYATPTNFLYNATIGSSANWTVSGPSIFQYNTYVSPNFETGSYMGFKTFEGNYGWLEVTWNSSTPQFEILGAAYESDVGVAIKAGDTGSAAAVPEIDPSGLASALSLVMGSAAMLEQRRRKRAAVAAVTVTA